MNFRALLALLWVLVAASAGAQTQQTNLLTGNVSDYGMFSQSNVLCTLTLVKPNPRTVNGIFVRQDPIPVTTAGDGSFSYTNIQWGKYILNVGGADGGTDWTITVQTNTTGTVSLASLALPAATLPPNPGTSYYTMSQVDALVNGSGNNGKGLTNNQVLPGTPTATNLVAAGTFSGDGSGLTNLVGNFSSNVTVAGSVAVTGNVSAPAGVVSANNITGGLVSGMFSGDGGALTNTPEVNITKVATLAANGVADDSAAIQAAAAKYPALYFPKGRYAVTNLFLLTGMHWRADNAELVGIGSADAVVIATNGTQGWYINGFTLTGPGYTRPTTWTNAAFGVATTTGYSSSEPYSGVRADCHSKGSYLGNLTISGFSGYGVGLSSTNDSSTASYAPVTKLGRMDVSYCKEGFAVSVWAEYVDLTGMSVYQCAKGISVQAGNVKPHGNQVQLCNIGGMLDGQCCNPAHSAFYGNNFNHCMMPFAASGFTQANHGEGFIGNECIAGDPTQPSMSLWLNGVSGLTIANNTFSYAYTTAGPPLTITNSGTGVNTFSGNNIMGNGSTYNVWVQNPAYLLQRDNPYWDQSGGGGGFTVGFQSATNGADGLSFGTLSSTNLVGEGGSITNADYTAFGDELIQPVPYRGMCSWYWNGASITGADITNAVNIAVANSLPAYGWKIVEIDDGWQGTRDGSGNLSYNSAKYNFTTLGPWLHSQGMLFGLYTEPKATTSAGYTGSDLPYTEQDAAQFAAWGVDYVKLDFNGFTDEKKMRAIVRRWRNAFRASGLQIAVYSGGWRSTDTSFNVADDIRGVTALRLSSDYQADLFVFGSYVDTAKPFLGYVKPGHYLDLDVVPVRSDALTNTAAMYGMACMIGLPAMVHTFNNDSYSLAMYKNVDLLAIQQDPLAHAAVMVSSNSLAEVWAKRLIDGRVALALWNRNTNTSQSISVNFNAIGLSPTAVTKMRNVWTGAYSYATGSFSETVTNGYADIFILTQNQIGPGETENVHANAWNLDGNATRLTSSSESGGNYSYDEGIQNAGNLVTAVRMGIPPWATSVTGYGFFQCGGTQAWTNDFKPYTYSWNGNVGRYFPTSSYSQGIVGTNGLNPFSFTVSFTDTNCPKMLTIQMNASTNSANRWLLGPLKLIYN